MPDPVLSQRRLNRALLARQLLLERSRLPLTEALETVAGLQTQYAPAGYIGSWSRLEDFRRPELTRALEDRSVVQATVMRATIHMVSTADYWPFAIATRPSREQWYLRAAATLLRGVDMDRAVGRVRADLRDGPRRHDELSAVPASGAAVAAVTAQSGGIAATLWPSSGWGNPRSTSGRHPPPRPSLPRRVRAGQSRGCRELDRPPGIRAEAGPRGAGPAAVPRRGRA